MTPDFTPNAEHERRHLETGFLAGVCIGFVFMLFGWHILGTIVFVFAGIHFFGWAGFETRGRDVHIALQALIRVVHWLITPVLLALMYVLAILLFGTIARVAGMNRLRRDYGECRSMESLFEAAPKTETDDFERQS